MSDTIAFFLPSFEMGGAQRVIVNIANELSDRDYPIELVCRNKEGPLLNDIRSNIEITNLSIPDIQHVGVLPAVPSLIQYFRKSPPKIMFSAMNHVNIPVLLAWKLSRSPTKMIISERNHPSSLKSIKNKGLYKIASYVYPWADQITANSKGVADDLSNRLGIPREQISVLHNPTVTDSLLNKASNSVSHPWFNNDYPPVVLGVGRLEPQKNFSLLIDSFSVVNNQKDSKLIILGEGSQREMLEEKIDRLNLEDHIQLPGFVNNPYKYMSEAAVFTLSSNWEGLPNALIEALACGCPVVSTDCPSGPSEILCKGKYGRIVPKNDKGELSNAILETLDESPNENMLRQRAQDFSVESISTQFVNKFII